ncbi:uncharacterized protein HBSAL_05100 [Halobacterium salinarum]|uniref:Uncharacterized protein n=1 Tax=Halobacterium salinarum (strain ATCC 33171 / DSM 3754 / JCM 8978 / NBRC 102687 / NCIMB 764 / 91-R6) TaxID=2597657 RepID=A0A4D6GSH1_HALS9|nr:uncharacterized protein HBSAL_05100 [Halobacterium salinarum]
MKESIRSLRRNQWQFRLVAISLLNVVWSFTAVRTSSTTFPFGLSTYELFLGGSLLILTPVFYHAIYRDTGGIRESDSPWVPDRRIWVGGGVCFSFLSIMLYLNPLAHYVAAIYLIQRYRKTVPTGPAKSIN